MSRLKFGPGIVGSPNYAPEVTRWQAVRVGGWLVWSTRHAYTVVWRPWPAPWRVLVVWRNPNARPRITRRPLWRVRP